MVKSSHNYFRFRIRIVNILIVIVFSIFFTISNTSYLYAQTDNTSYSWISSIPKVVSSNVVDSLESWGCAHSLSLVDQTTPNMIQRIIGIFERKPLISKEI